MDYNLAGNPSRRKIKTIGKLWKRVGPTSKIKPFLAQKERKGSPGADFWRGKKGGGYITSAQNSRIRGSEGTIKAQGFGREGRKGSRGRGKKKSIVHRFGGGGGWIMKLWWAPISTRNTWGLGKIYIMVRKKVLKENSIEHKVSVKKGECIHWLLLT